jgi:hypothetical protein
MRAVPRLPAYTDDPALDAQNLDAQNQDAQNQG